MAVRGIRNPYEGKFAPAGQQIVTRGSLEAETVQTGELATAFADNETKNAVSSIAAAVSGIAGAGVADIRARIEGIVGGLLANTETLVEHTEAIAELADVALAGSAITPLYASNLDEMASAPRQACIGWSGASAGSHTHGTTGSGSAGAHTHTATTFLPTFQPNAPSFSNAGTVYYTPVYVDRAGIPTHIRFIGGADGSFIFDDIDDFRVDLCVYNPTTGNVEKVTDNGNLRAIGTSSQSELKVEFQLGEENRAAPGHLLFVAHQQIAPGLVQKARSIAYAPYAGVARGADVLVRFPCYRTSGTLSAVPSSIALSSLVGVTTMCPWYGIGMSL
ncbi:hypothetical protein SEA_TINALIN_31 [Gordonia phage TinaLin]|uniref:Minor tail protein n=1 Tax=Gordonia phage TinaLin TaxID=2797324 RepID=A0A7T7GTF2_9CAUD|nr:minor tail protein [Gordonia phage TinaLin]QQM15120.1 hypothetical protein SEA_TINALIN_31 [Gordonia phage TinaLin]